MRKKKRVAKFLVFVLLIAILTGLVLNYEQVLLKKEGEKAEETQENLVRNDVDLEAEKLKDELQKTEMLVQRISSETQIVLLEQTGSITIKHDKNISDTGFANWAFNSEIEYIVNYTAILSISTEKIVISNVDGKTKCRYNTNDIKVKSVNIDSIVPITKKGILGKSYSPAEISALTEIAIQRIRDNINSDTTIILLANLNLKNYITSIAIKFSIFDIEIEQITGMY